MQRMMPLLLLSVILFGELGCIAERSDALELSDHILQAAIRMKQSSDSEVQVTYPLTSKESSLIAVVPPSGVERTRLPTAATNEQVSGLLGAGEMWSGHAFLAITWSTGLSAGPSIEREVSVPQQLSVLKPAGSTVTVRLVRDNSGVVSIKDLR